MNRFYWLLDRTKIRWFALILLLGFAAVTARPAMAVSPPPPYFGTNPGANDIRAKLIAAGQRYHIPPHLLFGIAMQESHWAQFQTDRRTTYNQEPDGRVGVGIMQITVYPSVSDYARLCTDIDYNIDRGAALLIDKWNATPIIGDGIGASGHEKLENWYYAIWAYNGFSPVNNPNYNSGAYQKLVLNWIANCPNGQWQNCSVTEPTNAQIGGGYPQRINNTPAPVHVDANYDGVIDSADSDIGLYSSERQYFLDCFYRNGGRGPIGSPINGAHWWGDTTRVVIQDFRGGSQGDGAIIDNEGTAHSTAYWLHGAIWGKYAGMGGPNSSLRCPLSDEYGAAVSKQGTSGRLNRFENGSLYYSSKWGAFPVFGHINQLYEQAGGTASDYGFPVGDVIYYGVFNGTDWYYQWFEGPKQGDWRYIIVSGL